MKLPFGSKRRKIEKLTDDERSLCETYFVDDPERDTKSIAEELGVDPRAINLAKGNWRKFRAPKQTVTKGTNIATMATKVTQEINAIEDLRNALGVSDGGGDDTASTLDSVRKLIESPAVREMFSAYVETARAKAGAQPQPQPQQAEVIGMTKEEAQAEHIAQIAPMKAYVTFDAVMDQMKTLPDAARDQFVLIYENINDLRVLNDALGKKFNDEQLSAILWAIHNPENGTAADNPK